MVNGGRGGTICAGVGKARDLGGDCGYRVAGSWTVDGADLTVDRLRRPKGVPPCNPGGIRHRRAEQGIREWVRSRMHRSRAYAGRSKTRPYKPEKIRGLFFAEGLGGFDAGGSVCGQHVRRGTDGYE